jgi:hypothetical protein
MALDLGSKEKYKQGEPTLLSHVGYERLRWYEQEESTIWSAYVLGYIPYKKLPSPPIPLPKYLHNQQSGNLTN